MIIARRMLCDFLFTFISDREPSIVMCEMWQICRRIKCSVPMQILLVFLFLTSIVGLSLLKLHLKNSVGEERDSGQF